MNKTKLFELLLNLEKIKTFKNTFTIYIYNQKLKLRLDNSDFIHKLE